jgi:hypothetical protein
MRGSSVVEQEIVTLDCRCAAPNICTGRAPADFVDLGGHACLVHDGALTCPGVEAKVRQL